MSRSSGYQVGVVGFLTIFTCQKVFLLCSLQKPCEVSKLKTWNDIWDNNNWDVRMFIWCLMFVWVGTWLCLMLVAAMHAGTQLSVCSHPCFPTSPGTASEIEPVSCCCKLWLYWRTPEAVLRVWSEDMNIVSCFQFRILLSLSNLGDPWI